MSEPLYGGYFADEDAFHQYTRGVAPIADQVRAVAGGELAGHAELPDETFSKVGRDVGLGAAIRQATQRQISELNNLAGSVHGMGEAVHSTWLNYQAQEDDNATTLRSSGGE